MQGLFVIKHNILVIFNQLFTIYHKISCQINSIIVKLRSKENIYFLNSFKNLSFSIPKASSPSTLKL